MKAFEEWFEKTGVSTVILTTSHGLKLLGEPPWSGC
jgi:hypothetical protein